MLGRYLTASSGSTRLTVSFAFCAVMLAVTGNVRSWSGATRVSLVLLAVTFTAPSFAVLSPVTVSRTGLCAGRAPWAWSRAVCVDRHAIAISSTECRVNAFNNTFGIMSIALKRAAAHARSLRGSVVVHDAGRRMTHRS